MARLGPPVSPGPGLGDQLGAVPQRTVPRRISAWKIAEQPTPRGNRSLAAPGAPVDEEGVRVDHRVEVRGRLIRVLDVLRQVGVGLLFGVYSTLHKAVLHRAATYSLCIILGYDRLSGLRTPRMRVRWRGAVAGGNHGTDPRTNGRPLPCGLWHWGWRPVVFFSERWPLVWAGARRSL